MVLKIKKFSKKYNEKLVIDNISVLIKEPKIVGLIGDNGAGKTTLLKCIAGFIRNYQGMIETNEAVSASIESPAFFDNFTVEQNLKFVEALMKSKSQVSIAQALKFVGLDKDINKKFRELSLGMKQKLIIARMMLCDSDIYLLDEPFNSLDVKAKKELHAILQKLKKQGKTLIISSHILDELSELSDAVWYLKNGKLIQNIDLHSPDRKYNILIFLDNEKHFKDTNDYYHELKKILDKIGLLYTKLNQTENTILFRTIVSEDQIFSNLHKLIDKNIKVLEYYDVTNKLDDYMLDTDISRSQRRTI